METVWQDVKYGARVLVKNRTVTIIAVLTLALGIGANTAIFTVVHAVLLRPLPYFQPDQLMQLWETRQRQDFEQTEASYPNFLDWKAQNRVFDGLAGYNRGGGFVKIGETQEQLRAGRGTANFFDVLGVKPIVGRGFRPEESQPGTPRVMLLTYGFWQRRFGGDPSVVGRTLVMNDTQFTIIGVLPLDFQFAPVGTPDIWTTIVPQNQMLQRRNLHWLHVIGRLKEGVTRDQARAEMKSIADQLARAYPDANAGGGVNILPLHEEVVGQTKPALLVLLGVVSMVLLIACVNVANLLLGQVASREREIAIRTTLGAGRLRVVRQLLAESVLLALAGGAAGMVLALWGVDVLVSAFPTTILESMPYLENVHVHLGVLGFNFAVAALVGILFGLAPALHATRLNLNETLKEGSRATSSRTHGRLRNLLVVSEVALALAVLAGTGLTLKSLSQVLKRDPGFQTERLISFDIDLPARKYDTVSKQAAFWRELYEHVSGLPGVASVGTTSLLPLSGGGNTIRLYAQGKPVPPPGSENEANIREVSSEYFRTLGIPLQRGRFFDKDDTAEKPRVAILNEELARRLFPGEDPVGRSVVFTFNNRAWQVVGVVGDAELATLDAKSNPAIYTHVQQDTDDYATVVVRASADPTSLVPAIRDTLKQMDADVPVFAVRTMEENIARAPSLFFRKYLTSLLATFAVLAMTLAAVGIYGVMSYGVTQRTHEFGIRMALGAQRRDVLGLVLRSGGALVLVGVVIGLIGSLALGRAMSGVLFGVSEHDPATFAAVAVVLILVALLACWIPARRATRVDPMTALRYE